MLSAKQQLAHVADVITESEAERILDLIGVNAPDQDAGKMHHAAELLKSAARLLYQAGSPECVQFGEQVDQILVVLLPFVKDRQQQS